MLRCCGQGLQRESLHSRLRLVRSVLDRVPDLRARARASGLR